MHNNKVRFNKIIYKSITSLHKSIFKRRIKTVNKEEPSHRARLRNPSGCHYISRTDSSSGSEEKEIIKKRIDKKIRQTLDKPPGN